MTVLFLRIQVFWGVMLCEWAGNSGILMVCSAFIFMGKQFKKLVSVDEGPVVLQNIQGNCTVTPFGMQQGLYFYCDLF
jgi:hypothetical protein